MMGIREYARHRDRLGLAGGTHRAVQVAIKEGRLSASLTPDKKKIRSARAADEEWAQTTHADRVPLTGPTASASGGEQSGAVPADLGIARARREAANAKLAEMQLAVKLGKLVDADEIEVRLTTLFGGIKTKLLGVVARAAQRDPSLTRAQLALFDELQRETLEDLSEGRIT